MNYSPTKIIEKIPDFRDFCLIGSATPPDIETEKTLFFSTLPRPKSERGNGTHCAPGKVG